MLSPEEFSRVRVAVDLGEMFRVSCHTSRVAGHYLRDGGWSVVTG